MCRGFLSPCSLSCGWSFFLSSACGVAAFFLMPRSWHSRSHWPPTLLRISRSILFNLFMYCSQMFLVLSTQLANYYSTQAYRGSAFHVDSRACITELGRDAMSTLPQFNSQPVRQHPLPKSDPSGLTHHYDRAHLPCAPALWMYSHLLPTYARHKFTTENGTCLPLFFFGVA